MRRRSSAAAPRARALALATLVALGGLLAAGPATARPGQDLPEFSAPVVDQAGVVPDDVEASLNRELEGYRQRSGRQVAVAVVETTGNDSLEDYTIDLAREWGVGDEGEDDGVLVLIAYEDRRVRIEVGRGVEGELTDLESGRIIREQMAPRLRDGDVGGALEAGTAAIRQALGDAEAVVPTTVPEDDDGRGGFPWPFLLFGLLGLASFGGFGRGRRRRGWGGFPLIFGPGLGGFGGFGGGGGGGGGFGGFGGGGGGGFGGGGASGDW